MGILVLIQVIFIYLLPVSPIIMILLSLFVCVCVCVCVCYLAPFCGVCPNYEVVEFKPFTVNPPEPRLCRLLLHIYNCPARPSLPTDWCHSGVGIPLLLRHPLHRHPLCLCTGSSAHLGITCFCPSIPMFPASPLSFAVHDPPLWTSLAPATPTGLLSSLHPCRC